MLDQANHSNTPILTVIDPRGSGVRSVRFCRTGSAGDAAEARVDRTVHDALGRAVGLWDPRLFHNASPTPNLCNVYSLSGSLVCSDSVDAGLRVSLYGEAGKRVQSWDGRGSQRCTRYDEQLRPSEVFEQAAGGESVCVERLTYAANDQAFVQRNQCGQLIRHDDPAGVLLFNEYALKGAALEQERRFYCEETDGYLTRSRFNPSGGLRFQTDAQGNEQQFHQTLDGLLRAVDLRLNDTPESLLIVRAIAYNAHGQVEQEVAGNGVITTLEYNPEDGRLKRLLSRLDNNPPLQDQRYTYDPVGNVLSIEDAALPTRFFANQRIEPISHYRYDTAYRLIEATGWEAGAVKHGPLSAQTADPAMPVNYRQTYCYDAGNNLLELTHEGAQAPGHRLVAEAHSNRCLPVCNGVEPSEQDFLNSFDANGNLLKLHPGLALSWDVRNQLREVRPIERNGADADSERYEYAADGMRVRKVRSLHTVTQTNLIETRYLPGLEIRTHSGTGEELHVVEVSTGRGTVRVLHWKKEKPKDIPNNQQRYSLTDHLGSCTLELDQHANVITQERYYPFGGTAWSSGEAVQVSYKTVRYSGKEQDATGLYYYGFRYYVPRLQRWLNPDPGGEVDGLNFYAMAGNSPLNKRDINGLSGKDINEEAYFRSRGISDVKRMEDYKKSHPKMANHVVSGVTEAIERFELAIEKLQGLQEQSDVAEILRGYLGDTDISRVDVYKAGESLIDIFQRARDGLRRHQQDNYENILLVGDSGNDSFFTYHGDSRIYMTRRANDRASGFTFARVFAHEVTHSLKISHDIWTVKQKTLRLAAVGDKRDQDEEKAEFARIALDPKSGSMFDAEAFMASVEGWFSMIKVLFQGRQGALESSLAKFKNNESIRRQVTFSNASSLESLLHALTAREVHNRYFPSVSIN